MTSCAEITTAMSSYDHSRVTVLYTMPLLCRKQIKIPCKTLSMKSCKNNQTKTNSQIVAPIGHINWPSYAGTNFKTHLLNDSTVRPSDAKCNRHKNKLEEPPNSQQSVVHAT